MHKIVKLLCSHSQNGVQGRSPCKHNDVILRARPQTILRPKDLVTTELFLGRRGAGEVVCTAPTQLNVYEYGKSLCSIKITQ